MARSEGYKSSELVCWQFLLVAQSRESVAHHFLKGAGKEVWEHLCSSHHGLALLQNDSAGDNTFLNGQKV